ncbi:hypothetical protein KFU94_36230 [Chloroflexi bacterium TSY]|nr:hypothetical protein [Chloroflexi bacterium TSY]
MLVFIVFCTVQANRLRRQLGWLVALQRLLSPDSQADDQVQVTAHSVASAVDQYLVALTQDTTLDDADRSIVQHINTTFRNRWWGSLSATMSRVFLPLTMPWRASLAA